MIAWLWARTVRCPNPACGAQMPLVRSFVLSTKKGKQAWVEPIVDRVAKTVRFEVRTGEGTPLQPPKIGRGAQFRCLVCNQIADEKNLRREFQEKRSNHQLMAIVTEGKRQRIYLSPTEEQFSVAGSAVPEWQPEQLMNQATSNLVSGRGYGITSWYEVFTTRQLVALTTLSQLVDEARLRLLNDIQHSNILTESAAEYANAVALYLAFALSRAVDYNSAFSTWRAKDNAMRSTLAKQAIPMVWDFAEGNPLASSSAGFFDCCKVVAECVERLPSAPMGVVLQQDARTLVTESEAVLFCTDPPYYNNIGYADLADFLYIWLRKSLCSIFPENLMTLLTPKVQELVAEAYRFEGNKEKAQKFFEEGLRQSFSQMCKTASPEYPVTVFYAFRQAEADDDNSRELITSASNSVLESIIASTGWETMLEGLLGAGFQIVGTWPMRTEGDNRQVGIGSNALASSIVLVCRPRSGSAPIATRREFLSALRRELPDALRRLQHGNIAPVDLAQAAIGPGMAVFSRYSKVVESNGEPMRVRTALQLINQALDEVLAEQEGEYDNDTRWAIDWFTQFGTGEGRYGDAEMLSKAKNTSVQGLVDAGVLQAKGGKVKLLSRDQLPEDWNPTQDKRTSVWEITQHLIRALEHGGEYGAAGILAQLGPEAEAVRDLAYRLYTICERKSWAQEALAYNSLVVAWPSIVEQKITLPGTVGQTRLDI